MKSSDRGVRQCALTVVLLPMTATTWSSSPARAMVLRYVGSVSISPSSSSTRVASWCSQPAWFSSEPRWWSTVNTTACGPPTSRAAAPR